MALKSRSATGSTNPRDPVHEVKGDAAKKVCERASQLHIPTALALFIRLTKELPMVNYHKPGYVIRSEIGRTLQFFMNIMSSVINIKPLVPSVQFNVRRAKIYIFKL